MKAKRQSSAVATIAFLAIAFCALEISSAATVDDFSVGQIVLTGPDTLIQTGLDPSAVAGEVRKVTAVRAGDTVEVLTTGGIQYSSNFGYGLVLAYGSEQELDIDTTTTTFDRLVLEFSGSAQPGARLNSLYVNLPPTGSANGLSFSQALFALGDHGRIEFLLADVPTSTDTIDGIIVDFARSFSTGGFVLEDISLASTPLAGDYNRDGTVDDADYSEWLRLFGGRSGNGAFVESYLTADGNYDGVVDAADYTIWLSAMGSSDATPADATAIPEPKTFLLVMIGLVVVAKRNY